MAKMYKAPRGKMGYKTAAGTTNRPLSRATKEKPEMKKSFKGGSKPSHSA